MGSSGPEDAEATGDHGTGEVGADDTIRDASLASGPIALAEVPPIMTPSARQHARGRSSCLLWNAPLGMPLF